MASSVNYLQMPLVPLYFAMCLQYLLPEHLANTIFADAEDVRWATVITIIKNSVFISEFIAST